MPYVQIFLEPDLDEQEARRALAYIRDHFPLRQSEGRLFRTGAYYLLFEQPEHEVLTFEQELWLEKHAQEAHIWHPTFSQFESGGCRSCGHPFDDSPTGYCPQCQAINPSQTTVLRLSLTKEENAYLNSFTQASGGDLRCVVLTALDLLDEGHLSFETVLTNGQISFAERARAFSQKQQVTCFSCGLPDEQCTCKYSTFTHHYRQFETGFEREYVTTIPLPRQGARRLQELAKQHGLTIETLIRALVEIPELQIANASRETAVGHVLSTDFAFLLTHFTQGSSQKSPLRAIRDVDGNTFSPALFQFAALTLPLAGALPLLEARLLALFLGQTQESAQERLAWVKEQLAACDPLAAQQAHPCTPHEIEELETLAGERFPVSYRAFLAWMGHGAGAFLQYLRCFFADLPGVQTAARELLKANQCQESLPEDAWVITMLAERHLTFFRLSEGDDSPVYAHRSEWRRTPFRRIAHHLSDFLCIQVALYAEYQQRGTFRLSFGKGLRERFLVQVPQIEAAMQAQQHSETEKEDRPGVQ